MGVVTTDTQPHTQGLEFGFLHHGRHAKRQQTMSTLFYNRNTLPMKSTETKGGAALYPRSWCCAQWVFKGGECASWGKGRLDFTDPYSLNRTSYG